jgi:C1A family cysteine protease
MAVMPAEFIIPGAKESRDQGLRSTCAAFAGAFIKEMQEYKDCQFNGRMSPEFIYYHRENKPAHGMFGRNVFQILQRFGSVPEDIYPYEDTDDALPPSKDIYDVAANYRIANFARVSTIDGLKRALLELGPAMMILPLCNARPRFWLADVGEQPIGGHAVVVIGYNEAGFILVNSWGPEWNDNGTIMFSYDDWNLHWECWVSIDEQSKQNISMRRVKHNSDQPRRQPRKRRLYKPMSVNIEKNGMFTESNSDSASKRECIIM